ncbi:hypothetical protein C8R43DRAFT_993210 [Mycena crocata]|nr:hypothetical protein C8R43DRAFT_993210 [Mycena crocata]
MFGNKRPQSSSIFLTMYTLLMARRTTLAVWVGLEASLAGFVYNAYHKPSSLQLASRLPGPISSLGMPILIRAANAIPQAANTMTH